MSESPTIITYMENKYTHIERLTSPEVDGILNGVCCFYPKLDGANASIELDGSGQVIARSRTRILSPDVTLQGFYEYTQHRITDLEEFFKNFPDLIIFGEWLVPHTIKTYRKEAWHKFYVYDIYNKQTKRYLDFETFRLIVESLSDFELVPLLEKVVKPTQEQIDSITLSNKYLLESGDSEGVVIKNYEYTNVYGRQPFAKVINEHFATIKKVEHSSAESFEQKLVYTYLTSEYVLKELNKVNCHTKVAEVIHIVYNEFVRDFIAEIIKKYKNPTINFYKLKKYVAKYVVATIL